jgi:hypothetical protein
MNLKIINNNLLNNIENTYKIFVFVIVLLDFIKK